MSDDPFGQFSKIFTAEFGKAAMGAWQETLAKSFAQGYWQPFAAATDDAAKSAGAGTPFDFFQPFMQQFSGAKTADFGGGAAFLQFGQFIQKYLDLFSAGTDPSKLAQQMSSAFQQSLGELANNDVMGWMNKFAQPNGSAEFFKSVGEIMQNNPFAAMSSFGFGGITKGGSSAAVGPAREWQKAISDIAKANARFRSARKRMRVHSGKTFESASEKFWGELGHGEGELTSLREIYDYWVDCAEDAYYDVVMTDDYARDFGEMINSQSALKQNITTLISRFLELLNIPNRREIDELIAQVSAITQHLDTIEQNKDTERETDNAAMIDSLRKDLARVQSEIAAERKLSATVAVHNVEELPSAKTTRGGGPKVKKSPSTVRPKKKKDTKARAPKKPKGDKRAEFEITKITSSS